MIKVSTDLGTTPLLGVGLSGTLFATLHSDNTYHPWRIFSDLQLRPASIYTRSEDIQDRLLKYKNWVMNRMKYLFLTLTILITGDELLSQNVCGAEIEKEYYFPDEQKLFIKIQVCRFVTPIDYILLEWGDKQVDTILTTGASSVGEEYFINNYFAEHIYNVDTAEYMKLVLRAGTIMEGFVNVDYAQNTNFVLTDSFFVYPPEESPVLGSSVNTGPIMNFISVTEHSGIGWLKNMLMEQVPWDIDSLAFFQGEFPVAGYMSPASEEALYIENGIMYWNYPIEPGKYAVAGKVRELKYTNNPLYEEPSILMSTITKAFTIIVDSANIVSTLPNITIDAVISLYPNPTIATTTLEYGGLLGELYLKVIDTRGRLVLQQTLESTSRLQREVIDVSTWPAGIYWLELISPEGRITKKIIVE